MTTFESELLDVLREIRDALQGRIPISSNGHAPDPEAEKAEQIEQAYAERARTVWRRENAEWKREHSKK